jgi:FixJ family two-component response regulator
VDDDQSVREALEKLLGSVGFRAKVLASAEDFIGSEHLGQTKCLILDVHLPGTSGLEHQARLVLLTLTPSHDRKH